MHAKQNPKLIYPPALSPPYPFHQNSISRIFFSFFFFQAMKPNDVSLLPVAEPLLKIAQRVSLKPEAIRETKA
jgi:hypothetical protein